MDAHVSAKACQVAVSSALRFDGRAMVSVATESAMLSRREGPSVMPDHSSMVTQLSGQIIFVIHDLCFPE
jgi:hypothetical protein